MLYKKQINGVAVTCFIKSSEGIDVMFSRSF